MQSVSQSFEFDLVNFLDVPVLLKGCIMGSVIGFGLLVLTLLFSRQKFRWLFIVTGLLTGGWYLLFTFGILSLGIWWPTKYGTEILYGGVRHTVVTSQAADLIYLAAWYAVSVLLAIGVQALANKFKKVEVQQ